MQRAGSGSKEDGTHCLQEDRTLPHLGMQRTANEEFGEQTVVQSGWPPPHLTCYAGFGYHEIIAVESSLKKVLGDASWIEKKMIRS